MGVAVSVRTSTFSFNFLILSLWVTPKRCSSSMIRRPRFLNSTSFESTRWVPMTMSTNPFFRSSSVFFCSAAVRKRDNKSTRTGKSIILWTKVL